jgi:hypothetical protein
MGGNFRKSSYTGREFFGGRHRFEHWYRDNSVYFITSKTRDGLLLFATAGAQAIFWDRFEHYTHLHGFVPWVTTLMNNHYHTLGYLRVGEELGEMMRKVHGSVAWLAMKETALRHVPFWTTKVNKDYFDGCIRDVLQAERAYRYTLMQSVRAGLVTARIPGHSSKRGASPRDQTRGAAQGISRRCSLCALRPQ